MSNCTSCGAGLDSSARQCLYCGTVTAYGLEMQRRDAEHARQRELQQHAFDLHKAAGQKNQASTVLDQNATYALVTSLMGSLCCCFPASIASIVLFFRVRSIAREHGLVLPTRAMVALVISVLGLLASVGAYTTFVLEQRAHEERVERLRAQLAGPRAQPTLDRATACGLAELHVLENGFGGTAGMSVKDILCPGHVTQSGETATLDAFQFRAGSTTHQLRVCLAQAPTWSVLGFRRAVACDQPSDLEPTATPDAGPPGSATPPSSGDDVPSPEGAGTTSALGAPSAPGEVDGAAAVK
ncbi:MAG: hypothetical protein R3B40_20085 [Polyangiales bacterium]|nr:hypothetical protein [Myxococcales bacterium]